MRADIEGHLSISFVSLLTILMPPTYQTWWERLSDSLERKHCVHNWWHCFLHVFLRSSKVKATVKASHPQWCSGKGTPWTLRCGFSELLQKESDWYPQSLSWDTAASAPREGQYSSPPPSHGSNGKYCYWRGSLHGHSEKLTQHLVPTAQVPTC